MALGFGGTGFIGEAFTSEAVEKGHRCRVLAHNRLPDWPANPLIDVRKLDLESTPDLRSALNGCDIMLNLLRPDGTGWHATVTRRLGSVLVAARINRYLHVSSIDVYGGARERFVDEDTPLHPVTPYAREHAAAEASAAALALDVGIVRLGAVFGPRGRNLLTTARDMRHAPLWKLALRRYFWKNCLSRMQCALGQVRGGLIGRGTCVGDRLHPGRSIPCFVAQSSSARLLASRLHRNGLVLESACILA